jgi:hypothetical protein
MKPEGKKRKPFVRSWGALALALGLFAISGSVLEIDIQNNYHQGAKFTEELGKLFAVAAIGYALFPTAAAFYGRWGAILIAATIFAGVITLPASYLAYTDGIDAQVNGVAGRQEQIARAAERKRRALADIERAEKNLAAAVEASPSATLREERNSALERVRIETEQRGGCPATVKREGRLVQSECAKAEAKAAELLPRIAAAEAREAAERERDEARARLAKVEDVADASAPKQIPAARKLGGMLGVSPEEAAGMIAQGASVLAMAFTAVLGLVMHVATMLLMYALGWRTIIEAQRDAEAQTGSAPKPKVREPKPAAKTGRPKMTAAERVAQWAAEALQPTEGADTSAARLRELFEDWKAKRCPDLEGVTPNAFASGLKAAGYGSLKVGGVKRYLNVTIKGETPAKSPAKRARKRRQVATAPQPTEPAEPAKKHLH